MADLQSGAFNLFQALAGGDRVAASAGEDRLAELVRQRSSRALMDERVSRAAMKAQEQKARIDAEMALQSAPALERALILGNLGSSYSGTQRGLGYEQQNTARSGAIDMLDAGGDVDLDRFNQFLAVAGNKLLTPSNAMVTEQAQGKVGQLTTAADENRQQAAAAGMQAALREAALPFVADKERAEIAADEARAAATAAGQRRAEAKAITNPDTGAAYLAVTGPQSAAAASLGAAPSDAEISDLAKARALIGAMKTGSEADVNAAVAASPATGVQPELPPEEAESLANARASIAKKGRAAVEAKLAAAGLDHLIPLL